MKVSIGHCNIKDSFEAGKLSAQRAISLGEIKLPSLVIAFCSAHLDAVNYFDGIKSVIGNGVPVIGGSAIGVITNNQVDYKDFPSAVAVIEALSLCHELHWVSDLGSGEKYAGKKLASCFAKPILGKNFLIFYDSLKIPGSCDNPPILNSSSELLKGFLKSLDCNIPVLGAGVLSEYSFGPTKQFCGDSVKDQAVVAVLMNGEFSCDYTIMHGCTPLDGIYHTITRKNEAVIHEIDGRPAAEVIDELYGSSVWRDEHPVKLLTIGINCGEKFEKFEEGKYVNRLITGVMPDGKSIGIFEPDLEEGVEFQFMLRDGQRMIESAARNSKRLFNRITAEGKKPLFALYIDCAGRTAEFSNTLTEEAVTVQKECNKHKVPLLGFYSGVEIAPLLGKSRGLDWTGVLIIWAK